MLFRSLFIGTFLSALVTTASAQTPETVRCLAATGTTRVACALNTAVDQLEGYLDGVEGFVDGLEGNTDGLEGQVGIVTETAPATDTASSGLNGRLQRVAQRLTTLVTAVGTPLQAGGTVILGAGTAAFGKLAANAGVIIGDVNVVGTVPLPTGASTEATLLDVATAVGALGPLVVDGIKILDEAGTPVVWQQPDTGDLETPASVTTTSGVCFAADLTARERILRNTGTARVGVGLADETVTILTATYVMDPGGYVTTGKDGYSGNIHCITESGTQAVALTTQTN